MFEIRRTADGTIELEGRLDASHEEQARALLDSLSESTSIDFQDLKYISSSGLGVLLRVQKNLMERGHSLRIINMSAHLREIFSMAGFDRIFDLE